MMKKVLSFGLIIFGLLACDEDESVDEPGLPVDFTFEFNGDNEGWEGDFADYPVGEEVDYGLDFYVDTLPEPLNQSESAMVLTGTNMSDDLFMFAKKRVTGLAPNTGYSAEFTVQFASDVPDGMVGVGGSPGESVWIKAGATTTEPVRSIDDMDYYRMDIDKGGQSQGGEDMMVLGDFSNDTDQEVYTLKTVTSEEPMIVDTNSDGELWIIVGTDSGFEATTTVYYNTITVTFDEP